MRNEKFLTPAQILLARQARSMTGSIESQRWKLAKLALQAHKRGVPAWAEVIGSACRRAPSTVFEWRRAAELRNSIGGKTNLPISFWVTAANAITENNNAEILGWLSQCEQDATITLESARANLPRAARPAPDLNEAIDTEMARLIALSERADGDTRAHLEAATEELRLAARAMGKAIREMERE